MTSGNTEVYKIYRMHWYRQDNVRSIYDE